MRKRLLASAAVAATLAGTVAAIPAPAAADVTHPAPLPILLDLHSLGPSVGAALRPALNGAKPPASGVIARTDAVPPPPTMATCVAVIKVPCYGPNQLAHAYGADSAQRLGLTGKGATIVLVESYGSDHIQSDLDGFDAAYGLPGTKVETIAYGGTQPGPATTPDQLGWGEETTLDVEYAHALAPQAHLIVLASDPAQTADGTGLDTMSNSMAWLVAHRHVDVMSLSWGAMEPDFAAAAGSTAAGNQLIYSLRGGLIAAAKHHVSIMVASGDWGPADLNLPGSAASVPWPASDPLVTAVGGTKMFLDEAGNRTSPDTAWSEDQLGLAGGAGLSTVFSRPEFQNRVRSVVGKQRGVADVSASASCDSPVLVYSYWQIGHSDNHGWDAVCGTSESAPLMAGLVGDAAALAHHPLGNVGAKLYALTPWQRSHALTDPISGCTTDFGVQGFCAAKGYDLATGWGSPRNATALIGELAFA